MGYSVKIGVTGTSPALCLRYQQDEIRQHNTTTYSAYVESGITSNQELSETHYQCFATQSHGRNHPESDQAE
jgi:hypothetical protein